MVSKVEFFGGVQIIMAADTLLEVRSSSQFSRSATLSFFCGMFLYYILYEFVKNCSFTFLICKRTLLSGIVDGRYVAVVLLYLLLLASTCTYVLLASYSFDFKPTPPLELPFLSSLSRAPLPPLLESSFLPPWRSCAIINSADLQ